MDHGDIVLFALEASHEFGTKVGEQLGIPLSGHEERQFEDGEHKSRPLVNVRNKDVFVIHSLYGESKQTVNDKLCRLLFFLGALRDASAGRVTAVVPYLCYSRKDRKTKSRDPVTTRYVAHLFEAVGIDHLMTMDVHNLAAFQNAFQVPTDHLEARRLFVEHFASAVTDADIVVVSPDVGGIKRAEQFREALTRRLGRSVSIAFVEKYRSEGIVSGQAVVGEMENRVAIIIDDLISTGTTLARAAHACRERGAQRVYAAATHGAFVSDSNQALAEPALEQIIITNTIPPTRLSPDLLQQKVVQLEAAGLFAQAIECIHSGSSVTELLEM